MNMIHTEKKLDLGSHPWRITAQNLSPEYQLLLESLFAQANGYIGSRGSFEEPLGGDIPSCEGVYLNGLYQKEPIAYGESAYGFPLFNQKMLQVPNGKSLCISLEGEVLSAAHLNTQGVRSLDLQTGILNRSQQWQTISGKKLSLQGRRFVSLANPHLMCIEFCLKAENFSGPIEIISALDAGYQSTHNPSDPRVGKLSIMDGLNVLYFEQKTRLNAYLHAVRDTDWVVASVTFDAVSDDVMLHNISNLGETCLKQCYQLYLHQGQSVMFSKWIGYRHALSHEEPLLLSSLQAMVKQEAEKGFAHQKEEHASCWSFFWREADIVIEGDSQVQQGIRFNLFHVFQSVGRNGFSNIGAKGLTGPGYDGHYFWDTEIYVVPFLSLTEPKLARKLIEFRINTLNFARIRAREMSHPGGALYPWRTIGGEECSAYFPAGTAQYHINAAIAYALKYYLQATGDNQVLLEGAAEMLFETARLWLNLGHFNPRKNGLFCIDGVTGPDEYTAIVNNNFYTNAMAQMHLEFAVDTANSLEASHPGYMRNLSCAIGLTPEEILSWKKAAEAMYLPYDDTLNIHMQDDSFLQKAAWNFADTPKEKYPLLLHYHPLVIYRHQVLKQADVILAMYLLDEKFDIHQKKRNLAYYEPLTTHDSSLSSCIHSIAFSETGDLAKAYQFFMDTVCLDLDNHHGNSEHGVHIANMAGSWASIVCGFAGLRIRDNGLHFRPYLPESWQGYRFSIRYRDAVLAVHIAGDEARYQLQSGITLRFFHEDDELTLTAGKSSSVAKQLKKFVDINQKEPA